MFSAWAWAAGTLGAGGDGGGAGVGDVRQDLLLEAHVALDGVHEVRDQVVAPLQLDLDLGECLVDPQASLDETVVDPDHEDDDQDDDGDDDDQVRCCPCPPHDGRPMRNASPILVLSLSAGAGTPVREELQVERSGQSRLGPNRRPGTGY